MAVSIVVLELRGDLLAYVRAGSWGDPGEASCLLGLETLLWGGGIDTAENSVIIKGVIAGICHCRCPACASIDVDLHEAVGKLHGVVVDDGEHLGGDLDRWAKNLGCGAIHRCCSRVAVYDWVLICHC